MPALALSLQCPELSHRDPLATMYGPTSSAAKLWAAGPSVVPVTANPSPGRRHPLPPLPPAQTVPGTNPRVGPQYMAAWLEDARGWPGTCRPALHFPEGSVAWLGKGYQCQEREVESQTNRAGGYGERACPPQALQRMEAACGGCQPACSTLPSFLQHTLGKAQVPVSSPPPVPAPGEPGTPKAPSPGGHMTQACGLAQSAFSSVVV